MTPENVLPQKYELVGRVTSEEINALPEHMRRFVRDLETIADPARMVQEIAALKDQVAQLTIALQQAQEGTNNETG